jgi:hypothetical protein
MQVLVGKSGLSKLEKYTATTPQHRFTGWWLVVGGKTTVTPLLFHCPSWEKGHTITVICVTVTYNKAYFWVAIEHSCRSPLLQLQLQPATATRNQTKKVHTIIDTIHDCIHIHVNCTQGTHVCSTNFQKR